MMYIYYLFYKCQGPHLYRTDPSGHHYEYTCTAIGARSQTANTYLENNMELFEKSSVEDLIGHAIAAMKKAQDLEITPNNIAVSIVGKNQDFKILTPEELSKYFDNANKMEVDK